MKTKRRDGIAFLLENKKKVNYIVMFVSNGRKNLETVPSLFLSFWFIMLASVKSDWFPLSIH